MAACVAIGKSQRYGARKEVLKGVNMENLINTIREWGGYVARLPLFLGLFAMAIMAVLVMLVTDIAERAYWRKYAKLQMKRSDGHHVMINGRCYTK